MYSRIRRIFAYSFATLLISSCAIVVAPTGGPKDVTPPKALSYVPENKSTHFNGHKIDITFNEYIQTKSLDKQLMVSPPLKTQPKVLVKGKVLEITFKDTLKDNATYTFNFGNSVVDNNEGNILKNFSYVVSTGDHIDTLSVTGNVQDAFTHDPVKAGYVMLYKDLSDSAPYKKPPEYIGLTDDQGHYKIDNIATGPYRLIALSNIQGDYLYHPYVEGIGFNSKITEIAEHDSANLNVFTEVQPKLKLLNAKAAERGKVRMAFNKPVNTISIKPLNMADSVKPTYTYISYSVTADTAYYWLNTPFIDSLRFILYNNGQVIDTAFVHSFPNNSTLRTVKKPKPIKLTFTSNIKAGFDYHRPIMLRFNNPVLKYDLRKIILTQNNDTVRLLVDTTAMPLQLSLNAAKQLEGDSVYKIRILPGAFTDMYGNTNDTIKSRFSILDPTYFGTLKIAITLPDEGHYIVQLLNEKNAVYIERPLAGKSVYYDALPPGVYHMRLIEDDNNNSVWDPGDFMHSVQPEKVYYYPEVITIRSNWELDNYTWRVK